VLHPAAQCIRQHLFSGSPHEIVAIFRQDQLRQARAALKLRAIRQHTRRVDRRTGFVGSPLADAVVIFEREADGIHARVARRAHSVAAMLLHLLAQRHGLAVLLRLQLGHVGRRRWRRCAQEILENPLSALDYRRAVWI